MANSAPPNPWDEWVPGVLTAAQLEALVKADYISRKLAIDHTDQSSFDLTLADEAYLIPSGSVKPSGPSYLPALKAAELVRPVKAEGSGAYLLEKGKTYLFRIEEYLKGRKYLGAAGIHGQATARSSVGRADVLARLIVDGQSGYEGFGPPALEAGTGEMFLEITSLTFDVLVKPGTALTQLRLFYGNPDDVTMNGAPLFRTVIRRAQGEDGMLSVDLSPASIGGRDRVVALSPKQNVTEPVRLWNDPGEKGPDPSQFWERVEATSDRKLIIQPGLFYILRSKELMRMPAGIAVYCRASDETLGEMRIHYAGFVHPHFGRDREDGGEGTPLIFEVRGHDFKVQLSDGERMARLTFYRMSKDAPAPQKGAPYNNQGLKLSGFFAPWPDEG